MDTIWLEIKNSWQIISGILVIICIPIVKRLYENFKYKNEKYHSNLKELESFYDSYSTDETIRNKPKFFHDEKLREFKEFNQLDFQFFIFLIENKNMNYRNIVEINSNLRLGFSFIKIADNQLTYTDEKSKTVMLKPNRTKLKYISIFLLFTIVAITLTVIISNLFFFNYFFIVLF